MAKEFEATVALGYPDAVPIALTISPVPDGGMTVALFGSSLMGLAAFRRKLFC